MEDGGFAGLAISWDMSDTYPGDHIAVLEFLPRRVSEALKADSPWWSYASSIHIDQKGRAVSRISGRGQHALERLVSTCTSSEELAGAVRHEFEQSIDRVDAKYDRRVETVNAITELLMAVVSTLQCSRKLH